MKDTAMSRRGFGAVTCLFAAAGVPEIGNAQSATCLNPQTEAIIRKHYDAWVRKDWVAEDALLADDFTFSSAAGDDHISKSVFKTRCWDNNAKDIKRFDLLRIYGGGDEAFVKYSCLTMDGKSFQNVEFLQLSNGRVKNLECFFGAPSNYPSAVSAGRK